MGLAAHYWDSHRPCGVDVIKPKSHQAKKLVQGHTVNEWQTQESNPRLTLEARLSTATEDYGVRRGPRAIRSVKLGAT